MVSVAYAEKERMFPASFCATNYSDHKQSRNTEVPFLKHDTYIYIYTERILSSTKSSQVLLLQNQSLYPSVTPKETRISWYKKTEHDIGDK